MSNEKLMQNAKYAIDALFEDLSVTKEKCLENLEELQADVEAKIDVLREEMDRDG